VVRPAQRAGMVGAKARRASGWVGRGAAALGHGPLAGSAAPRSVARQTLPHHRSAPRSSPRHPSCCATMHDVAQAFRRAREIGVGKSVSFRRRKK